MEEKRSIRERIWRELEASGAARFPGAFGRIPNFAGAEEASLRLRETKLWKSAGVLKCNPDSPQQPVRRAALEEGKKVFMAVPRLRQERCFIELDPARISDRDFASTIKGAFKIGHLVHAESLPEIDLVVAGSVAVNRDGARLGKGGGYSDLEFALAAQYGKIRAGIGIATTVHPLQLIEEPIPMTPHDIPVDIIATPEEIIKTDTRYKRPAGIQWELVSEAMLAEIPILQSLKAH